MECFKKLLKSVWKRCQVILFQACKRELNKFYADSFLRFFIWLLLQSSVGKVEPVNLKTLGLKFINKSLMLFFVFICIRIFNTIKYFFRNLFSIYTHKIQKIISNTFFWSKFYKLTNYLIPNLVNLKWWSPSRLLGSIGW